MSVVEAVLERYKNDVPPDLLRSSRFWAVVSTLARSPLNRPALSADKVSLRFFVEESRDAFLKRRPVVWANLLIPSELIHGAGAVAFYPELASAVLAGAGLAVRCLDAAEEAGFSPDLCSYHRAALGAALGDFLPAPDMLLSASRPCEGAGLCFSALSDYYGAEHTSIEIPALVDSTEKEAFLAGCIEDAGARIASLGGRGPDSRDGDLNGSLARAMELSNEARRHILEVEERRTAVPCPLSGWDAFGHLAPLAMMPGTQACVDFYRSLNSEIEREASKVRPSEEIRLLWIHLKPCYESDMRGLLERRGAFIVCEEYNRCYWEELDPADPYRSLARKMSRHPLGGAAADRAEAMALLAERYSVDAAVLFNHRGCRQSCGSARQVKDQLESSGVRTLILEGECIDEREHSGGQMRTRLEAFLETLDP